MSAWGIAQLGPLGLRLDMAVFAAMVALVGGRLVPSFTRNQLAKLRAVRLPQPSGWLDTAGLILVPIALLGWVTEAAAVSGPLLIVAGAVNALRLMRWQGFAVRHDALLLGLHAGFGWLCLGLVLLGLSRMWPTLPELAGLHAVGAGAMGTMILTVMSRQFSRTPVIASRPRRPWPPCACW